MNKNKWAVCLLSVILLVSWAIYTPQIDAADGDPLIAGVNRGTIIGGIFPIDLTSSETITGASTFGGWMTSSVASEVTATLGHSTGAGENIVFRNLGDTSLTGGTIFGIFEAGVSNQIITESGVTIVTGATAFEVSGTTLNQVVVLIGSGVSIWELHSKQTLSLRNQ